MGKLLQNNTDSPSNDAEKAVQSGDEQRLADERVVLSVIMPVYNEEECIEAVVQSWLDVLGTLGVSYRLLVINDGSTDDTSSALRSFAGKREVQVVDRPNGGHGAAVLDGYRRVAKQSEWVFQVDSDDEIKASEFGELWRHRNEYDLVVGWRKTRGPMPLFRRIMTWAAKCLTAGPWTQAIKDANAPFRLMRSAFLREWLAHMDDEVFAPNTLMTEYATVERRPTRSVPVKYQTRQTGQCSISGKDFFKLAWRCGTETLRFRDRIALQVKGNASRIRVEHALFLFFSVLLLLANMKFTWPDGDDGRYAVWAVALAQGEGLTNIHLPEPTPETTIPPGLSIALAAVVRLFGDQNLSAMMATSAIFFLVLCVVHLLWLKRDPPPADYGGVASAMLGLWGVFTISFAWRIHTEILYMMLAASVLLCWRSSSKNSSMATLAGVIAGSAFITRTVGLAFLPAGMFVLLLRNRIKAAFAFALGFVLIYLPFALRSYQATGAVIGYTRATDASSLMDYARTISVFFPHYLFVGIPELMFYRVFGGHGILTMLGVGGLGRPLGIIMGSCVLIGMLARMKRADIAEFYFLGYMLVISSFNQADYAARGVYLFQNRYVIPILPLAAVYLVEAIGLFGRLLRGPWGGRIARVLVWLLAFYVMAIACAAGLSRYAYESRFRGVEPMDPARYEDHPYENDRAWGRYFECMYWLADNAPADSLIICRKPYEIFLGTGHNTIRYIGLGGGRDGMMLRIENWSDSHTVYLIEDSFVASSAFGREREAFLVPFLRERQDRFSVVYETEEPSARVWKYD